MDTTPLADTSAPEPSIGMFERTATFLATHGVFPWFTVAAALYQWWLFKGELYGTAALLSLGLWAAPALLSALGWACWGWMKASARPRTNAWLMTAFAVAAVAYLWGFFPAMDCITGALSDGELRIPWLFSIFLGMLPMVYAGVGRWMDAGARKGNGWRWWRWTLGIGFGGVLALVVALMVPFTSPWHFWGSWMAATLVALGWGVYVVGTLAALFGLLRLTYWLGKKRSAGPHHEAWRIGQALLFGLALPLGGLALNLKIPFPADFATPWTWGIAIAAGVVLLTPLRGGISGLLAWALRWAVAPYVLYFFLLFLPFHPLTPAAMLAAGAGILMLAPLLLFQFWCRDVAEGWRVLRRQFRPAPLAALATVAALALPLLWMAAVEVERADVRALVAWHVGENFDLPETPPPMGMARARSVMTGVNNYRFGIETPFLTAWRTWRVYGGMHMANPLRQALNRRILGREIRDPRDWEKSYRNWFGEAAFSASRGRGMGESFIVPPPTDDFEIARVDGDGTGGYAITILARHRDGAGAADQELVLDFRLPVGTWLEGARLKMPNGEWKDARASERKAAEWTYLKIAHQRSQDPLLVTLDMPTEGRLRLFPVSENEPRELELKVRLPAAGAAAAVAEFRVPGWKRSRREWEHDEETDRWTSREVVDQKEQGDWVCARPQDGKAPGPEMLVAEDADVTYIKPNWFSSHAAEAVHPAPGGEETVFDSADPDLPRKLRRVLRQAWRRLEAAGPDAGTPRVAFSGKDEPALSDADKRMLRREFPGLDWLGDDPVESWFFLPAVDGRSVPVPWRQGQGALVFARLAGAKPVGGPWAEGAKVWALENRTFLYPGEDHRADLLALTRKTGVLTTQSAYIVLENTIQEKELSLDEKRALAANKSMDFHETDPEPPASAATPEPSTLALLALGAALLTLRSHLRRK